jgi:chorismate dehydratase
MTTDNQKNKPRLGLISYINSLPIVLPILKGLVKVDAEIIFGEPTTLNELFAKCQLECGAMSAFAFLEQSNHLELIPAVSISSQASVSSVLLFSKEPIESNIPLRISVPAGSATSINAMLLLLAAQTGIKRVTPQLTIDQKPILESDNFDAALVIGDRALLVDEEWSKKYCRYDLGQWWFETFNLPMVFGVFAFRTEWFNTKQLDKEVSLGQIGICLATAVELGLNDCFEMVLDEAQDRTGLNGERLRQYFKRDLDFSWSIKHQASLDKYEQLCKENGIFDHKKVLA